MNINVIDRSAGPFSIGLPLLLIHRLEKFFEVHNSNIPRWYIFVKPNWLITIKVYYEIIRGMNPISEIRRLNLISVMENRFGFGQGAQAKLAAALDKQPNVISRAINKNAKGYRQIGDMFAREIEAHLGLKENWLDNVHRDPENAVNEPKLQYNSGPDSKKVTWVLSTMRHIIPRNASTPEEDADIFADLYRSVSDDPGYANLKIETIKRHVWPPKVDDTPLFGDLRPAMKPTHQSQSEPIKKSG